MKGQNPPCWYAIEKGKVKTHFIFDVAIYDDYMDFRMRDIPTGGAFDDGGSTYAEEFETFDLESIPFGTRLGDQDVSRYFEPLFRRGKDSKVRSYSCVFSILVWDKISVDSENRKERWKHAHDRILEGYFGTIEVIRDEWEHGSI